MNKFFIAALMLFSTFGYAQTDKERFKEIFDSEITEESELNRSSHSAKYQYISAQKVPDWFITPPLSDDKSIYAIGISDPGLDTTEAMNLALLRAQVMANILRKSTTQLLCDFFLNEKDQSNSIVYEHYTRISTKMPNTDGNYELVNSFRNCYDETLVLIKYNPPTNVSYADLDVIKLELYKNETESSTYEVFESVYELFIKSNNAEMQKPLFYQLTELGERSDVVSEAFNEEIKVPIYTLDYMGIPANDSTNHCLFSHGLWKEYFKSVLLYIVQEAREKPENISFLADKYQVENYQKLTRGVSVNKMRFVINGFSTEKGKLIVNMTELALE